jgi:hypothetical protein
VLILAAGPILKVYGSGYATHTTTLLGLLAVGTIPGCLVVIAISLDRIAGQVVRATWTRLALTVLVLGGSWVLVKRDGVDGIALAWGSANLLVAITRLPTIVGAARRRAALAPVPALVNDATAHKPLHAAQVRPQPMRLRHQPVGRHRVDTVRVERAERQSSRAHPPPALVPRSPAPNALSPSENTARALELLISLSTEVGFPS